MKNSNCDICGKKTNTNDPLYISDHYIAHETCVDKLIKINKNNPHIHIIKKGGNNVQNNTQKTKRNRKYSKIHL